MKTINKKQLKDTMLYYCLITENSEVLKALTLLQEQLHRKGYSIDGEPIDSSIMMDTAMKISRPLKQIMEELNE